MAGEFKLTIITPEQVVYEADIISATIPTRAGEITVMARHMPLVSVLSSGEIKIKKKDHQIFFAVSRGVLEVRPGLAGGNNQVVILTDFAEHYEEIDLAAAQAGRDRAAAMLAEKDKLSAEDFAHFEAMLERELARIKIGFKRQSR